MTSFLLHSILILSLSCCVYSTSDPLRYVNNRKTVVLLSIDAEFDVTGGNQPNPLKIPSSVEQMIGVTGSITPMTNVSDELISFNVAWNGSNHNQFTMFFNNTEGKWKWTNATFTTETEDGNTTVTLEGMITQFGNPSIEANANNSFLCNSPLDFSSPTNDKVRVSVRWSHFQVEVYPKGMNGTFDKTSGTCTVDFDDKIVPIAVGGALGLLLLLVVIIYVISYIRDRRQQSKELRSGYNRIDHPEPNHHS